MSRRVERFEFELAYGGETIWAQLAKDYGFPLGHGHASVVNRYIDIGDTAEADRFLRRSCEQLLAQARRQLEDGRVYTYDYHADLPNRITRQVPSEIVGVRPVFGPVKGAT